MKSKLEDQNEMSQKIDEMKSQQEIIMDEIIQLKEVVKLLEAELSRVKKGNCFNGKDDYDRNKDEKEKYKVNHFSFDDKSDPRGFISNIGNSMIIITGGNSNPENPV